MQVVRDSPSRLVVIVLYRGHGKDPSFAAYPFYPKYRFPSLWSRVLDFIDVDVDVDLDHGHSTSSDSGPSEINDSDSTSSPDTSEDNNLVDDMALEV